MLGKRVVKLFMATLWPSHTAIRVHRINLPLAINMTQNRHMGMPLELLTDLRNILKSGDADHSRAWVFSQESLQINPVHIAVRHPMVQKQGISITAAHASQRHRPEIIIVA